MIQVNIDRKRHRFYIRVHDLSSKLESTKEQSKGGHWTVIEGVLQ